MEGPLRWESRRNTCRQLGIHKIRNGCDCFMHASGSQLRRFMHKTSGLSCFYVEEGSPFPFAKCRRQRNGFPCH